MVHVRVTNPNNEVYLRDLKPGDVFLYGNDYYIVCWDKLEKIRDNDMSPNTAVRLSDGLINGFGYDCKVVGGPNAFSAIELIRAK